MRRPTSLPRRARAATLAWLVALVGCSPLASRPPPRRPLAYPDECSTSRWPVVGDAYLAANTGGLALLFVGAAAVEAERNSNAVVPSWDTHPLTVDKGLLIGAGLSVAATVALIASARYGLESARACDAAQTQFYVGHVGMPPAPGWPAPGTQTWPPPVAPSWPAR
jgi:hypothetical protein